MIRTNPTVSTVDFSRLTQVTASPARVPKAVVEQLDEKLAAATLVAPETMQPDVVTMNSKVLLSSSAWDAPREYRLVYPEERNAPGELSILSSLGTELIGARTGTRFALGSGPNVRYVELVALTYQPEAAGHWNL